MSDDDVAAVTFDRNDDSVVAIVGSGAGGGTLAHELSGRGIDVVLFDAGPRFRPMDFANDDAAMYERLTWHDRRVVQGDSPIARNWPAAPTWVCKAVGGSTVHWAGLALRLLRDDFRARTVYGGVGGADLLDWPLTYDELAPFYARAEDKLGVTGTHGIPPLPWTNNFRVMALGARRLGYRQIGTTRMAINPVPRDGRNACDQIGFCMQGCKSGAKWSTLYTEIPRAEATGHAEVRSECMVLRIEQAADGRVSGVVYADARGIERRQRARAVAVAGNAIETPRLLLNSATNRSPDGLANSSGHLGRHYMRHVMGYVYGVFGRPVNAHRGTPCAGILEDERPHDPARGFAGGYVLGAMALSLPSYAAYLRPAGWGAAFAADVEAYGYVSGTFANGEDMPMAGNAIALHPTERDGWGLPIPLITINEHPCDIALRNHALKAASAIQVAAGAQRVIECPPMPGSHNMGTARMSATPRDGVVDGWGCCHDVRNLFVSDGSAFPTAGGGNPTLTIVALALRQAGHIAERMRRNEL